LRAQSAAESSSINHFIQLFGYSSKYLYERRLFRLTLRGGCYVVPTKTNSNVKALTFEKDEAMNSLNDPHWLNFIEWSNREPSP